MKNILTILWVLLFISCQQEQYRNCEFSSKDEQLTIYNNILNELVEKHFYNYYLREDEERIFKQISSGEFDSTKLKNEVIALQNKLFNDSVRFCTVYLDTLLRFKLDSWARFQTDTSYFFKEMKPVITSFSDDEDKVLTTLNTAQTHLKAIDFNLCTSKVAELSAINTAQEKCVIGRVSFSNLFLDTSRKKGILCYNFRCGDTCGKGELIIIEKRGERWHIVNTFMLWIS